MLLYCHGYIRLGRHKQTVEHIKKLAKLKREEPMPGKVDSRQAVHALSDALDMVDVGELQHGKRVAAISMANCHRQKIR